MELILEFCQNHNGNVDTLYKMLDQAAELDIPTVKLQCAFADDLCFRPIFEGGYESDSFRINKRPYRDEYKRLKTLEVPFSTLTNFVKRCEDVGILPAITAFNYTHLTMLRDCGFKCIKIASYDCGSDVLLDKCSDLFDRLIVSTGATYDYEIENASKLLDKKSTNYCFLHCVTIYPTPIQSANIERLDFLRKFTQNVGYSDHFGFGEVDINLLSKIAIFKGAQIVERHFTALDRSESKDGPVSINANDVKELKQFIELNDSDKVNHLDTVYPDWRISLGKSQRELSSEELANREYYRGRFFNRIGTNSLNLPYGRFNWERDING